MWQYGNGARRLARTKGCIKCSGWEGKGSRYLQSMIRIFSCHLDARFIDCKYLDPFPSQPEHFMHPFVRANLLAPLPYCHMTPSDEWFYGSLAGSKRQSFENEIYAVVDYLVRSLFSF